MIELSPVTLTTVSGNLQPQLRAAVEVTVSVIFVIASARGFATRALGSPGPGVGAQEANVIAMQISDSSWRRVRFMSIKIDTDVGD